MLENTRENRKIEYSMIERFKSINIHCIIFLKLSLIISGCSGNKIIETDVLIIGGGASGTTAGIQSARLGAKTMIVEETPWLGGMLTSAAVSAIDGNYRLASGLWGEFRQALYDHYGSAESVKTGWVSNVLFEPQIGEQILSQMVAKERLLDVKRNSKILELEEIKNGWLAKIKSAGRTITVKTKITIDATELGDVAKMVNIPYDIGMDSRFDTGEEIAPTRQNDIIQDLTYVAILKDYKNESHLIKKPPINYDPAKFFCTCEGKCNQDEVIQKLWNCDTMMNYGKLPNNYYMINWPIFGNDYYTNILELRPEERARELQKAKDFTIGYVYYLQHELGFKNLGIADDIFDTPDHLPYIPYHRESRRIQGLVRFTINDLAQPFKQEKALYRTGIAVGDYPVDHHHYAYPKHDSLPDLHFYPVPSYNLPIGTLIPTTKENFIVAEKSISVSNIVNGTTRLQPVCLLIGQASGVLAALSANKNLTPSEISIREVQNILLESGAFIMPYSDIQPNHPAFNAVQRVGATGIIKGEGKNIGWENHTLIYPDSLVSRNALIKNLYEWLPHNIPNFKKEFLSLNDTIELLRAFGENFNIEECKSSSEHLFKEINNFTNLRFDNSLDLDTEITRAEFASILDKFVNPFDLRHIDHNGKFIN